MKKIYYLITLVVALNNLKAQDYCNTNRYTNAPVFAFTDVKKTSNLVYGVAQNWLGNTDSLRFDYYELKPESDSVATRPTIILVHGGSFLFGTRGDMQNQAIDYVRRGFNVASISYRLGWNFGTFGVCNGDTIGLKKAIYRAIQDGRAALRYLHTNSATFKIDTNAIFMGGISAGGAMAVQIAYISQGDLDRLFAQGKTDLGHIDSSGNNLPSNWKLRGVINMWGAIIDTTFNQPLANIPVISFHGTADATVPYISGPFNSCVSPITYPTIYGSSALHDVMVKNGVCSELNYKVNGGHGVYDDTYITSRTSCFIKSVLCGVCTTRKHEERTPSCATGVGIAEQSSDSRIQIYPSPANNLLTIEGISLPAQIEVYTITGTFCMQAAVTGNTANVQALAPGMYLAKIGNSFIKFAKN